MNTINEIIDMIKTGKHEQLEKIILESPALADAKTEQGISLLQFSAYCRNQPAIDIFRKCKLPDLYEAASIGEVETVNNFIDKNPELANSFSLDGFTPLGLASFFGHHNLVKLLLHKGANPNIASNNTFNVAPLHSACAISNYDIAETLIKNGADVNAKQQQGVTPLHSAAHNGNIKLVKLLIDNGADINAKMDNGHTPLFMAEEKNFKETVDLIKCHGEGYRKDQA